MALTLVQEPGKITSISNCMIKIKNTSSTRPTFSIKVSILFMLTRVLMQLELKSSNTITKGEKKLSFSVLQISRSLALVLQQKWGTVT